MTLDPSHSRDRADTTRMSVPEFGAFLLTLALCSGACYAALDLFFGAVQISGRDVIIAMLLASMIAIPALIVVAGLLRAVFFAVSIVPTRRHWVTILPGIMVAVVVSLAVAVLLDSLKDWVRLVFLVFCLPLSFLVVAVASKPAWLALRWRAVIANLAMFQALVVLVLGSLAVPFVWVSTPSVLGLASLIASAGLVWWIAKQIEARPVRAGLGVSACLGVTAVLMVMPQGSSMLASGPATAHASVDLTESPPAKSVSNRPNVVLIVLDTTRRDHLGCYGHSGGLTPALDAIAAEGVVYEQAISQSPWTVPSHATMFTGLYPASHGCSNEHHLWLDDEFETLAELLSRAGYQTLALNSNVYLSQCNLLQGFDKSVLLRGPYEELSIHQVALAMGRPERWVDKGASEGLAELEHWFVNERDTKSPFFLFLNLYETHVKYLPPHAERVEHLPQGVNFLEAARVGFDYRPTRMHIQGAIDPPQQQTLRALYAAEVRYQDRRLGEVLDYLRQNVDFDNTLVMITADHGENLGESGRWEHLYSINDLLIHVPLVIRYPSHFPAGTRIEGLCELVDLLPTVLQEVGLAQHEGGGGSTGRSIRPNGFAAKKAAIAQVWPYYLYLNKVEPLRGFQRGLSDFITHRKVLRLDSMKFVWSSDGRHQLYDITADPYEALNLVETMPELAQQLQARLESRWVSLSAYQPRQYDSNTVAPIDDRALMQLRSLGYVGD